jgi:ankyrin repeat protein
MSMHSFCSRRCYSPILRLAPVIIALAALACSSPANCGEIHQAAWVGDLARVRLLLKSNPDLAFSKNNHADTPLHFAAFNGHKDVAELLLASNADVNATDKDGWTPLHFAADKGHKDIAELLLANQAAVNAKAVGGYSPLSFAASSGSKDVVEFAAPARRPRIKFLG